MTRPRKKSSPSQRLPPAALDFVAGRFRVLGEPMRLKLLIALETGEKNVTQLVEFTRATQGNISKHLGILSEAGMVARRKEGLKVFYFISDPQIIELCDLMCSRLEKEFAARSRHFR